MIDHCNINKDITLLRSEWSKSHYSPKPEAEVNNDLFSTRAQPGFENMLLLCTYELCNVISCQVEL